MLEQSYKIEARNYMNLCDIQTISICSIQQYNYLRQYYEMHTMEDKPVLPDKPPETKSSFFSGNVYESGSTEARNALTGMFSSARLH